MPYSYEPRVELCEVEQTANKSWLSGFVTAAETSSCLPMCPQDALSFVVLLLFVCFVLFQQKRVRDVRREGMFTG